MNVSKSPIISSPVGLAAGTVAFNGILLVMAWAFWRDSGIGWFGSLIAIFSLGLQILTGKLVWELRRRYVRQATLSDSVKKLRNWITQLKRAMDDNEDWLITKSLLGRILGNLEAIRSHVEWPSDVESTLSEIKDALAVTDKRLFRRQSSELVGQAERLMEFAALQLREMEWGSSDD